MIEHRMHISNNACKDNMTGHIRAALQYLTVLGFRQACSVPTNAYYCDNASLAITYLTVYLAEHTLPAAVADRGTTTMALLAFHIMARDKLGSR